MFHNIRHDVVPGEEVAELHPDVIAGPAHAGVDPGEGEVGEHWEENH